MSEYKYKVIRQQVDGLSYINETVKLKRVGLVYKGLCPFHGEKTASFTVYPKGYEDPKNHKRQDYATFYCFGCGAAGDVINFKQHKENLKRDEACDALIIERGLDIEDENAKLEYLKEQYTSMVSSYGNMLSTTEINLICSSICRNYLLWVKEYFPSKSNSESEIIEKYYRYFDVTLLERSEVEAKVLIDEVIQKITKRRQNLIEEGKLNEKKSC